jgi:ABC-type antimicrobial peptide transport system permease subunit
MEEMMANSIFAFLPLRMGAVLASIQGVIGLGLAVMGLYAVVAFGVNQRTRELGIRMALGASGGTVVREVVRSGMRLALIGATTGLVFSIILGFALSKVLFGMRAVDPLTLLGGTAVLLAVATLACWLPARRATRIDPAIVLRAE